MRSLVRFVMSGDPTALLILGVAIIVIAGVVFVLLPVFNPVDHVNRED